MKIHRKLTRANDSYGWPSQLDNPKTEEYEQRNSTIWSNGTITLYEHFNIMPTAYNAHTSSQFNAGTSTKYCIHTHMIKNIPDKEKIHENKNEIRDSILAGSIAGMTSCTLFHPFDVIRTKIQASTKIHRVSASSSNVNSVRSNISSSSGPLQVFSHTMRNGGLKAFYTGFSFPLIAQAAYKATVFTTNRIAQNLLIDIKSKEQHKIGIFSPYQLKLSDHFICGAIGGFVNALAFVSPVEYIRNQLIAQHTLVAEGSLSKTSMMHGPFDVIKATIKSKGIYGLYTGTGVTLLRDSFGCGSFFVHFELGKRYLPGIIGRDPDSQAVTICSGLLAGFGYWFASLPLDSLKTLVQTGKSTSALETVKFLIERDGFYGGISQLYRGWQLAFGRGSPAAAVTLTTYSAVYSFGTNTMKKHDID
jgi:solute carrier family 25 carnitine/acylcarnitine transporter 20/29